MRPAFFGDVVPLAVVLISVGAPALARRQQSYVIVMSNDHTPVVGLGPEDIVLRDGGVRQSTLSVEPARDPLSIVLIASGLNDADQISLKTAEDDMRRAIVAANASSQVRDLATSVAPAGSPRVSDAIVQACRALSNASTDRRVVLLVVRDHAGADGGSLDAIVSAIYQARASLWVVEIRNPGTRLDQNLDAAIANATKLSGALRETAANTADVPAGISTITNLLLSQYVVSYRWPDPMLSQLNFATRHDRGDV